jgi:hypothetical protein
MTAFDPPFERLFYEDFSRKCEYEPDDNPSSAIAADAILNAGFASRSATPPLPIFPRAPINYFSSIKYFRFFLINYLITSDWGRSDGFHL